MKLEFSLSDQLIYKSVLGLFGVGKLCWRYRAVCVVTCYWREVLRSGSLCNSLISS